MASLWSRFFGSAGSQAVGVALGTTAVPTLLPAAQYLINEAWHLYPDHPLIAAQLAEGVATGEITEDWALNEARMTGINTDRFKALVKIADIGPGVSSAFDLWRREIIDDQGFKDALKKQGMEDKWANYLVSLKDERLTPAQVALGIVRSILKDKGQLVEKLDLGPGKVKRYPESDIDVLKEAAAHGVDPERLRVMVGEIGLPMSAQQAASAYFRGLIDKTDYNAAIAEGDTRPEWAEKILEEAAQFPSAINYIEHHLRGWSTQPQMYAGTAKHGMSEDDTDLLFEVHGRPLSFHQVFIGLARGGVYDGPTDNIDPAFLKQLRESNIRPEWYNIAWAQRYTLPSAFVLRALTADQTFTAAQTEQILIDSGWVPAYAKQAATKWANPAGSSGDPHVSKAQTQLWGTLHTAYLAGDATETTVLAKLQQLGVDQGSRQTVLDLWNHERELIRQRLTPAQVKKAMAKAVPNPATGAPWSYDDALTELLSRGWSSQDANTFLHE